MTSLRADVSYFLPPAEIGDVCTQAINDLTGSGKVMRFIARGRQILIISLKTQLRFASLIKDRK